MRPRLTEEPFRASSAKQRHTSRGVCDRLGLRSNTHRNRCTQCSSKFKRRQESSRDGSRPGRHQLFRHAKR